MAFEYVIKIYLVRLNILETYLKRLMIFLDSKGTFVKPAISNLDRIKRKKLVEFLREEGIR